MNPFLDTYNAMIDQWRPSIQSGNDSTLTINLTQMQFNIIAMALGCAHGMTLQKETPKQQPTQFPAK